MIDIDVAFKEAKIQQFLDELDQELIGLETVKTRIKEIAALLLIARLREEQNIVTERPTLHMSFTGKPGTGKTTVAIRMAQILHHLGYVRRGHVVVATRDDLVGQYVGHTAPKTKDVIKRANEILQELERHAPTTAIEPSRLNTGQQIALFPESSPILDELSQLDITTMTPMEAINKLYEWHRRYAN